LRVWGVGGFGDLLFMQPNLMYLKEKYPSCKIFFSCKHNRKSIVKNWTCIDEIIDNPFAYDFIVNTDYQIYFQDMLTIVQESNQENIYKLFSRWFGLDLSDELLIPKLEPDTKSLCKCKEILNKWNLDEKSFIILQIDASSIIRMPRLAVWRQLINALTFRGHKITISGSPVYAESIDNFIKTLDNPQNVFNFLHESDDILDAIAMTSLSKLAISPDSALIHIAGGLGVKSFGIYGAFPGKLRLSTYKNCDWIDCKADCAPCFFHHNHLCKNIINNHPVCYDNLDIDEAMNRIEKLLNKEIVLIN